MKRAARGLLGGILLLVLSCAPGPGPGPTIAIEPISFADGTVATEPGQESGSQVAEAELGFISILVRWPDADRSNQVIPTSARSVRIDVLGAGSASVASRTLARTPGAPLSAATIPVPAGSNYQVSAKAFYEAEPGPDAEPIALGDASNVFIRKSKTTQVVIRLAAVSAPAITGLSPGNGGPGREIELAGRNFGSVRSLEFAVRFGDATASVASRVDDQTIRAQVPAGARSGNVSVVVDGVESASSAPFSVIGRIDLPPIDGYFLTGASRSLVVTVLDTARNPLPDPVLTWNSAAPNVVAVDDRGAITSLGTSAVTVNVTAESGSITGTLAVVVWPRPVSVTVTPSSGTLNAQADDGVNDPGFVTRLPIRAEVLYADQATDSNVTWSTSDASLGTYSSGFVVSAINAPAGQVAITATANRDGKTNASATLDITNLGHAEVTVQ